jgi:NAD(P)-dependent dehydrogenase (short-subunit alcohol dehydrogenase family)
MGLLENKVIIVTGATAGIGKAAAQYFAREGAKVIVAGRREKLGTEAVQEICAQGGEAIWVRTDVCIESDIQALVQTAVDRYGRLDGSFNNAAVAIAKPLIELSNEDWDTVLNTNLKALFWCLKYEVLAMLQCGGGSIVNCASIGAERAGPALTAYSASKGGIVAMSRTVATEYAEKNIRVNTINPGTIETEMATAFWGFEQVPAMRKVAAQMAAMNRIGQPIEAAQLAGFLLSDLSSYITAQQINVDGGANALTRINLPNS